MAGRNETLQIELDFVVEYKCILSATGHSRRKKWRGFMANDNAVTSSTNLQKAVSWISEVVLDHPEKDRTKVLKDAQVRFDLTPAECEFLTDKFTGEADK